MDGEEGDYLEIRNITLENSGVYICNIDMMVIGKSHAHFINVIVTGEYQCSSCWQILQWQLVN